MSDATNNIASPTPDEKRYDGPVTKEEYEQKPESNTGATAERDVDKPNPKDPNENPELNDEARERERKHAEIMEAERNQPDNVPKVLPPEDTPLPDDADEKLQEQLSADDALTNERTADDIANEVTNKQRRKLDSNS